MKSLLHEGSSIIKAVEAAWASAGMPQEFSIKVLEAGEKNFFGMTKRPAVVSIMYDPVRDAKKNNHARHPSQQRPEIKNEKITRMDLDAVRQQRENNPERQRAERPERSNRSDRQERPERQERQARSERQERQPQQPRTERAERTERPHNVQQPRATTEEQQHGGEKQVVERRNTERNAGSEQPSGGQEPAVWSPEMAQEMMVLFNDILKIMQSDVTTAHEIQGQQLLIKLSAPVLADKEQERNLYSSLAFLMLQIIKKTYKKRFKGYRVMFDSKQISAGS